MRLSCLWGAAMRRREFISFIAGAAAWPLAARAQQQTMPVIGFLSPVPGGAEPPPLAAFMRGLAEEGYVEGKNLAIENRFTNFRPELMPGAVGDLVRLKVNVIFAVAPEAVAAARNATSNIPIVGVDLESDPLAMGYIKSLARPGGNLTGIFLDLPELGGKQIELLKEIVPRLSRIAIVGTPDLNAAQFARRRQLHGRSRSKLKLWKCRAPMTSRKPSRPAGQGMLMPVSCCHPHSYSTLRSNSASLRWPNGSPSFPCSPSFQESAVSLLTGRT